MKKFAIACAIVLAAGLSSCGDTNYCYELTAKWNVLGVESSKTKMVWTTSNEIDASVAEWKKALASTGIISEDAIDITYKKASNSQEECQ